MILPIRTNVILNRKPYMNYAIIAVNVVVFLLSWTHVQTAAGVQGIIRDWATGWKLYPDAPQLSQFVTYAFLHGGFWHIFGNMFFLYVFGNNVNDKLGNLGYLCFYLAGAVFAGFGHSIIHPDPIPLVGASGAVAAVTGAYLVLFPKTLITVIYWLIFIGTIEVPAIYFIGFKMIFWDNVFERSVHNVAYDAHLAGYFFGIGSILLLLAVGVLARSQFDLWAMIKRWNQRRKYKSLVEEGFDPFSGVGENVKKIKVKQHKISEKEKQRLDKIQSVRSEIGSHLSDNNLTGAAEKYLELMDIDDTQTLSRKAQLDVANQLMAMGKWQGCAEAYEKFLEHYKSYQYSEQVELMLGIVYGRYLGKDELAVKYLEHAKGRLTDEGQKQMCETELERLKK